MSFSLAWPIRRNRTPLTASFLGFMTALGVLGYLFTPAPLLATGTTSTATASWDRNTDSDTSGYKLYFGTSSRNYTTTIDVGAQTSYVVSNLQSGLTYYFAATAYTGTGVQSSFSEEVSYVVPGAGSTLYADFAGYGFYKYDGSAWTLISTVDPASMTAGQ
jgi:hypothetical protein